MNRPYALLVAAFAAISAVSPSGADELANGFKTPPHEAKPQTWWHWMNGNITKEGITADLEAMKKIGLGGAQIFDIDYGIPRGKVDFASPEWFDCVKHAAKEAKRLGLELALNTASGWSCAGGPWNVISNGMKFVTYSEKKVKGPSRFAGKLPPLPFEGNYRSVFGNFSADIAVIAYPTPADGSAAAPYNYWQKIFRVRNQRSGQFKGRFERRKVAGGLIDPAKEIDLTGRMSSDGSLAWDVPQGEWTILRIGYCSNGRVNYPPSACGYGLECDKLSARAQDAHWAGFMDRLLAHLGPGLVGRDNGGVTGIIVDSYEAGSQNWTDGFESEFERRTGYSIKPWLPVFAGRVVGSEELTERFLEDFRRVVSLTFIDNFGFATRKKAHAYGLDLYVEPYGDDMPAGNLQYARCADVPMTEFWVGKVLPWRSDPAPAVSEAHVWGKKAVAAEAYTTWPKDDRWTLNPAAIKRQTDYIYCSGVNRMIYHTYAHQPWMDPKLWPGMTMGRFGIMFNRNVTWWDMGGEWIKYQSRCQHLLRQGRAVADAFYFDGENTPCLTRVFGRKTFGQGSDYLVLSPEALHASKVVDGFIVSPGGVRARYLLIPEYVYSASPEVMRRIESFVDRGVILIGDLPTRSFGLKNRIAADREVREISARLKTRKNVYGHPAADALKKTGFVHDFKSSSKAAITHIHRVADDGSDIYFVAAQNDSAVTADCSFRVKGRIPEIWDPVTGNIEVSGDWSEEGNMTRVKLDFPPDGSFFVVFRPSVTSVAAMPDTFSRISEIPVEGEWKVSFPAGSGAPSRIAMDRLVSWTERPEEDVRYFSGTAVYSKRIAPFKPNQGERVTLDLGDVRDICEVTINGVKFPVLWKKPFSVDITEAAARADALDITVRVANNGANRLIGDARKPDDCMWTDKRWSGPHLVSWPVWMTNGQARASGRRTFTTWRHWTKDDKPLPSGMLGPVKLRVDIGQSSLPVAPRQEGRIVLAARGFRPSCAIVIPDKPAPSVTYAAQELREHVKALTGVSLDVVREGMNQLQGRMRISLDVSEDPELGADGFEIRTSPSGGVTVRGGSRGVLYGVYELLERYGGIVWTSPTYTHVPKCDVFSVPAPFSMRDKPAYACRYHDTFIGWTWPQYSSRCRLNELTYSEKYGGPFGPFDAKLGKCHTFLRMVPPSKYYDTHPEYFSLVKGKRLKVRPQLCLTNPDVFDIVLSNVCERIRANRTSRLFHRRATRYYGISQDDWNNYCECEKCAAIDAREESHAGCVIWFVNKIAEAVEKKYPDVIIETLAYMYGRKPPKYIKPRDNVMICLCTIECDFSKPMATSRYKENVDFRTNVLKWRDISKHLYIWDYAANWRATPVPYPNLRAYTENIRFFYDAGVRYLFEEGISSPSASFTDLKGWLGAKLMWDPFQPAEPLIERFCEAYYGKGAPFVLEFIKLMDEQEIDETKTPIKYAVPLENMPFRKEFYLKGRDLWLKAQAAAKDDPEPVRRHVAWGLFGLEYALAGGYAQIGDWRPAMLSREAVKRLDRAEYESMRKSARFCQQMLDSDKRAIVSSRLNDFRLKGQLRALAESEFPVTVPSKVVIQDWAFNYSDHPRSTTIFRVDDKSATDGRALSVNGETQNWSVTCPISSVLRVDKGARYRLRLRAKTDAKSMDPSRKSVFAMGLFDRVTKKSPCYFRLVPGKASEAYQWYDVGEWTDEGHELILWVDPRGSTFSFDCIEVSRVGQSEK